MHVVFRCDSTKTQGLGHVFRAVSVADAALAAGHTVEFLARIESEVGRQLLSDHAFELTVPESIDPVEVAEWAAERRADVVHVDSYEDQGALRDELSDRGILLSNVEDGVWGRRSADVVVDPSAGAERVLRPWDSSHRLLRGVGAIALRQEILADLPVALERRAEADDGAPLRVLIVMGGTDARNMTSRVARWWQEAGVPASTTVVSAHEGLDAADAVVVRPGPGIARSFAHMDLVISGSGTTMWELAALGVPTALVQLVENQTENYSFAVGSGMALGLGSVAGLGEDPLAPADLPEPERSRAVEALRRIARDRSAREAMADRGRALVDGRGGERIVAVWAESLAARAEDMTARPATLDDASVLYEWRNDESVRAVSRSKGELDWDSHVDWVAATLERDDRSLWIVQRCGEPVATVRFDRLESSAVAEASDRDGASVRDGASDQDGAPESWEVSITVAPSLRGQGMAGAVLQEAERSFAARRGEPMRLVAEMLESNPASRRLFESLGYAGGPKPTGPADGADSERWLRLVKEQPLDGAADEDRRSES